MTSVRFYIDGFNLYHALLKCGWIWNFRVIELSRPKRKWLTRFIISRPTPTGFLVR
jgi:hypothetical protein